MNELLAARESPGWVTMGASDDPIPSDPPVRKAGAQQGGQVLPIVPMTAVEPSFFGLASALQARFEAHLHREEALGTADAANDGFAAGQWAGA